MTDFLPQDYKIPDKSSYFKFKDGENTFRILSPAIIGWEYWNTDNKPVRSREPYLTIPDDIRLEKDGLPSKIKHFWAFIIWNYEARAIQIFKVTQKGIQTALKALVDNKRWGDPKNYDITITRTGEGFDTDYVVQANPHSDLEPAVTSALSARLIKLEALFDGANPFDEGADKPDDPGRDDDGYAKAQKIKK